MNNTNICPIFYSNKSKIKNKIDNSLDFYRNETRKHIKGYMVTALKFNRKKECKPNSSQKVKNIIYYILHNDDLFNNLMTAIMLADFTHDVNRGSLEYWRSKNCLWTLSKTLEKNKNRLPNISNFEDTYTPLDEVLKREELSILEEKIDSLDQKQQEIIKLYYEENLSEHEIGKMFSISQQRISKIILNIRKKLNEQR